MNSRLMEIERKIDEKDIVSFDIFDTLLLRNVYKPTDIFKIMSVKVLENWGVNNFDEMRINAERDARTRVENQEVNLDEIYEELGRTCELPVEEVKNLELDLEYEFITVNPFIKEVYEYAKERGKRILFISDMYLSKEFVRKLLGKCGYEAEELFISNEYRAGKGEKKLYEIVEERCRLDKSKWIHIGDNFVSDYEKALEFGIEAYYYKNVSTYETDTMKVKYIGESIIAGIRNNYLYNGQELEYWQEFGAKYVASIYFGFTKWLYELTKKEDNLYFLARDGYAIKKIYEMFCEKSGNPIYTGYLYCSRRTLQIPALAELSAMDKAVVELTALGRIITEKKPTVREILKTAQVTDFDAAEELVYAFGFTSLEEEVSIEQSYMLQKMAAKLSEHIRENILSKKDLRMKYLEQEKIMDWDQINIMDVGWRGSCQEAIEDLTGKKVTGYYFGTLEETGTAGRDTLCTMYGWYFDRGIPACNRARHWNYGVMYELLFSAPHGTVMEYDVKEDGKIVPILKEGELCDEIVEQFQKSAEEICRKYYEYHSYMDVLRPEFCMDAYEKFLDRKDQRDLEMFRNIQNEWVLGNQKEFPYVVTLTGKDIESSNEKRLRRRMEESLWKNAFLIDGSGSIGTKSLFVFNANKSVYENYLGQQLGYAKIYFDFGKGFSEKDSIVVKMKQKKNKYSFELNYPFQAKAVRIDPIEYHRIMVGEYSFKINGKEQKVIIPHRGYIASGGYRKIKTKDPQFIAASIDERITSISFEAELKME